MWIIIAGTVIASMISSAVLLASLAVGKRGDEWEAQVEQPAHTPKAPRFGKPAIRATR